MTIDSIGLAVHALPSIAAASYLVLRSRDGLDGFGWKRPRPWVDLGLGLLVFTLAWMTYAGIAWPIYALFETIGLGNSSDAGSLFTAPKGVWQNALVIPSNLANAAGEELILCALNVRFAQLFRNRVASVLLVALLFASYHIYQGPFAAVMVIFIGLVHQTAFLATFRVLPIVLAHAFMDIVVVWSAG